MSEKVRRRIRLAGWLLTGALIADLFTVLYIGSEHASACAGPCDCTTVVDRPCR